MTESYFLADDGAVIASDAPITETLVEFLNHLDDGSRLLDIGAGTGRLGSYLHNENRQIEVIGLERNESIVMNYQATSIGTKYVTGDALTLPFEDVSFDAVVAYNSYHEVCSGAHNADRAYKFRQAIHEATRVLKPGGKLFIFDGNLPIPSSTELTLSTKSAEGKEILKTFISTFSASDIHLSPLADHSNTYSTDADTVFALMTKYKYILQKNGWQGERSQLYTFIEHSAMKSILEQAGLSNIESHFAPNEVPLNFLKYFAVEHPSGDPVNVNVLQQFRCATIAQKGTPKSNRQ